MKAPLVVWLGRDRVGELVPDRQGFRFHQDPGAIPLTVAGEGAERIWAPAFGQAWFDGLLPEEGRRSAAEREHEVQPGDTFALLAAIGWECAGAVSVLPPDRRPAMGTYQPLTDDEVWERLDALPRVISSIDRHVRLSLGGAQHKLLLARLDGRWHLPLEGAISTHILKPEPDRFPGLAVAEAWSLAAATPATTTAVARLDAPAGHRPTLVIDRYDRRVGPNEVVRIHQEDGCQVLGLVPAEKYPRGTGPRQASLARIAGILVARAADAPAELVRLLEQTVVNIALANTDAHAKNVSLVHTGARTVSLSPLYDVAPTQFFLPAQRRTALPVNGKWRIDEMTRAHLLGEARSWGIPGPVARDTIIRTLDAVQSGMSAADARYPTLPPDLRTFVGRHVERLSESDF
jgi:HipA N-terminal domain